jgi:hypothetical protein
VRSRHPARNRHNARINRRAPTSPHASASHAPAMRAEASEPEANDPAVSAAGEAGGGAGAVAATAGKTPTTAPVQTRARGRVPVPVPRQVRGKAIRAARRHLLRVRGTAIRAARVKARASGRLRQQSRRRHHRTAILRRPRAPPRQRPQVPVPTTNTSCGRPRRATFSAPVRMIARRLHQLG